MTRVRRILLPSDFTDSAATAGEFAADLALRYDAGIDVVHVFKSAQDFEPFVDWLELDRVARDELERVARLEHDRAVRVGGVPTRVSVADTLPGPSASQSRASVMGDFLRHHAKPRLEAVLSRLVELGVAHVRGRLLAGNPSRIIIDLAANGEYQLVVMASHGHSGLADALIGSCVDRVVRRSPVPVLVVPIPREALGRQSWPEMEDAELFGWVGDPRA
jgi:nucleotide-binding universal stress UspA family protein